MSNIRKSKNQFEQITNIPVFISTERDSDLYLSNKLHKYREDDNDEEVPKIMKDLHDKHNDKFISSTSYSIKDLDNQSHNKFPYEISIKKKKFNVFVSIDSRYRDRSHKITDGIRFNISLHQPSTKHGILGVMYPLDNITEIEVMNSFMFPRKFNNQTPYLNFDTFNEITMLISEIQFQSIRGSNNRYHFSFKIDETPVDNDDARVKLKIPYNSVFTTYQPFNLDKTVTLQFFSPTNNISLDDDHFNVYIGYTNPATITVYGNTDLLSLPNLINTDSICFDNFKSSSYLYDSSNPNSVVYEDKFYTVTPTNDPYTYSIPLDLTSNVLTNDLNKPSSDPISTILYTRFYLINQSSEYINIFYESNTPIANVGNTIFIYKFVPDRLSPPYVNPECLLNLYNKSLTIGNVVQYGNGYSYSIYFNGDKYPIIIKATDTDPDMGGLFYATINKFYAYPPVNGATIYVGSRRIRVPLRFELEYSNK
jgi:hypothetical protein